MSSSSETKAPEAAVSTLHADMPDGMVAFATEKAREALAAHVLEKDQAEFLTRALMAKYGGLWHAIVGCAFGMSVTHEKASLALLKVGKVNFLVFQTFDDSSLVRTASTSGNSSSGNVATSARSQGKEEEE